MLKIIKITEFHLDRFKYQTMALLTIILLNILISFTVTNYFSSDNSNVNAGSIDIIALIWISILSVGYFVQNLRYLQGNSVSRKTFFLTFSSSLFITTAFWAACVTILETATQKLIRINILYRMLYNQLDFFKVFIWTFAALLLLAVLSWFFFLIYFNRTRVAKFIITIAICMIPGVFTMINLSTNGILLLRATHFLKAAMGFSSGTSNSMTATLNMILLAIVLFCCNYIFIRKAQLRE
jgi:hypothetical protein